MNPIPQGSDTAAINAVSMPTYYVSMVNIDGELYLVKKGELYHHANPDTKVVGADGQPWTLDMARADNLEISDTFSDVSWRTPFGAEMQYPHGTERFLDALGAASPDVNTIRVDFNAYTLENGPYLARFQDFCQQASERGYKLIVQYSDGEMAGRNTPDEDLWPSMTDDPSGRMAEIGTEWQKVMNWFEQPENAEILDSVYAWELVNEPMAYGNSADAGEAYARDIASLFADYGIDWHDKSILVGGLKASAQFENLDLDTIRDAIGDDLVWSWHLYPQWANDQSADFDHSKLQGELDDRISAIYGDNILLTETQFSGTDQNGDGLPDFLDPHAEGSAAASFNFSRAAEWLADSGVGMTYWPPIARGSSFIENVGKGQFDIKLGNAAFANNAWSYDEVGDATEAGDQEISAEVVDFFKTPFAQAYGRGGNDTIDGQDGMQNMLFGGDGADEVRGGDAADFIFGQRGEDSIDGAGGDDYLYGSSGDDSISGGDGDDLVEGGDGRNLLEGEAGDDVIIASGGDEVQTGEGEDLIILSGTEEELGPVMISEWDEDDLIDLSNWEGKDPLKILTEEVEIEGQDPGLRITIDGQPEFDLVLTAKAAESFRGAESFTGNEKPLELEDLSADGEPPEFSYDPESGLLTDLFPDLPGYGGGENLPGQVVTDPEDDGSWAGWDPDDEDSGGNVAPGYQQPTQPEPILPPVDPVEENEQQEQDEEDPQDADSAGGGACFVATAAYGDRLHPEVVALRHFRDHHLIRFRAGRAFIRFYWKVGPVMARHVNPASRTGRSARWCLSRFVRMLNRGGLTG